MYAEAWCNMELKKDSVIGGDNLLYGSCQQQCSLDNISKQAEYIQFLKLK